MTTERPWIERNTRERERMRALVARASDDDLRRQVNAEWTVAGTLCHIAFWDAREMWLADKVERGEPFTPAEVEPDPPAWINDSARPFLHAIPPRVAADLALRIADEVDRRVAAIPPGKTWPTDPRSLLNPLRAAHRAEHLDEIEAVLRR